MRMAVFGGIHSNTTALEAVLDDLKQQRAVELSTAGGLKRG